MAKIKKRVAELLRRSGKTARSFWRANKAEIYLRSPLYVSSVLIGFTFIVRHTEPFIFVALLPLVHYVIQLSKIPRRSIVLDFYVAGFILCGFGNLFLFDLDPQNWSVKLSASFALFATFLAWMLICSFCALSFLAFGAFLAKLPKTSQAILSLPFAFAVAELIRSYLFAIMAYGPHGKLSPNFNWGSLAVPASGTPLVYASRLVGFFGLTALVVAINICIYALLTRKRAWASAILLILIATLTYGGWREGLRTDNKHLSVSFVPLKADESLATWDSSSWPKQGTDLLVLPEYSEFLNNPNYKTILKRLSKNGLAVTTIRAGKSPLGTNRLIYINRDGVIVNSQDKTFLIPTGETLPYSLQASFLLLGQRETLEEFRYIQQITNGKIDEYSFSYGGHSYGALACSGISALGEYNRLSDHGADILINSASLAFLKPHSRYHVYARNMARFHAVSNNKPLVQASRSGESYTITSQGDISTMNNNLK
ncbi:MAG: nitrilase-related carbon-nitrogen hydrolase [Candidatus Saccharibacteria bacterium]